jgi:hypothetical protein
MTRRWTLLGTTSAGKTFFVYSAINNYPATSELSLRLTADADFKLRDLIEQHMREGIIAATKTLNRYEVWLQGAAANIESGNREVLEIVDGPGGDGAPTRLARQLDATVSTRDEYLAAVRQSDSLLLFLPCPTATQPQPPEYVRALAGAINAMSPEDLQALKRVAVCITKCDQHPNFPDVASGTGESMGFNDFTCAALKLADPQGLVTNALRMLGYSLPNREIAFFAVSSFGMLAGTPHRNLLPEGNLPVLYNLPLSGLLGQHDVPIYPRPFTETELTLLWQPFNVHAPIRFLACGGAVGEAGLALEAL